MRTWIASLGMCLFLSAGLAQATPVCLSSREPPCPSLEATQTLTVVDLVQSAVSNERPFARRTTPLFPAIGSRRGTEDEEEDSARLFGEIFLPAGGFAAAFRKRLRGAPELATFTLIGSALLGIGVARRRRQA